MTPLFSAERIKIIDVLIGTIIDTPHWDNRWNIEAYVHRCIAAGFCDTDDKIRACALRYMAGKRRVTPPGHTRRKEEAKKRKALLANVPPELTAIIASVLAANEKAISQYKSGNEKVLNALVGQVMKQYRTDPAIVKELLLTEINK